VALNFNVQWIHGAANCAASTDPRIQTHALDPDTFVLRESKCLSFEAPFLYLLAGSQRAFLLDTGARPESGPLPVRETVTRLLSGRNLDHVAGHSHSHGDHLFADEQFRGRPRTRVAPVDSPAAIRAFYGLSGWPDGSASLDLGGRKLTIFPIPGHEPHHIAVFDQRTGILLTGDVLYPGMLTVRTADWGEYKKSAKRLADFANANPVAHVLGAHIEMTKTPKVAFPLGTRFQPNEHVLQLGKQHVIELNQVCESLGPTPVRTVRDDFILTPQ